LKGGERGKPSFWTHDTGVNDVVEEDESLDAASR
jgi:hypothetical protein